MILTCPECSARFAVPDALIPPEGRTVKCGRCAHQWHADASLTAEGESFAELAMAAQEAPVNPSRLPVRQAEPIAARPFIFAALTLFVSWVVVAFIAYYPGWQQAPVLGGVYRAIGIYPTDGLVFEDIGMQRNEGEGRTQFVIAGSVTNHAPEARMVPVVRVQLKNKQGEAIWERKYPVNEMLEAGKPYAFRIDNVETSFAGSVASIALDLGHPLQLMMR